MRPLNRILLACYTSLVLLGAAVSDEPIPAAVMAFALGYQTKSALAKYRAQEGTIIRELDI
jgi:hypothetical protein